MATPEREREYQEHIAKLNTDIEEHEKTVKALKSKFREFEDKLKFLVEENERLKELLRQKEDFHYNPEFLRYKDDADRFEKENRDLKDQLRDLKDQNRDKDRKLLVLENRLGDNEKDRKLEEMRQKYENQLRELQNQLRDANKHNVDQLMRDNQRKDKEIRDLEDRLNNMEAETDEYIQQSFKEIESKFYEKLQEEREKYAKEMDGDKGNVQKYIEQLKQEINENENRIALLITDNERLNTLNFEQAQEIKALRDRLERNDQEWEDKLQDEVRNQLAEHQKQNQLQLGHAQNEIERLRQTIQDLQVRQILFFVEIERLYQVQFEILGQLDELKTENEDLLRQLQNLQALQDLIERLKEKHDEQEQRISNLIDENSRLSDLSLERLKEIDNLKAALAEENIDYDSNRGGNKFSNADLSELAMQFESQKNILESQVNSLQKMLDASKVENQRLKDLNEQRKKELEEIKLQMSRSDVSPMKVKNLENELRVLREQYNQAKKEIESLTRTRDLYKSEIQKSSNKNIETLNELIRNSVRAQDANTRGSMKNHLVNELGHQQSNYGAGSSNNYGGNYGKNNQYRSTFN